MDRTAVGAQWKMEVASGVRGRLILRHQTSKLFAASSVMGDDLGYLGGKRYPALPVTLATRYPVCVW